MLFHHFERFVAEYERFEKAYGYFRPLGNVNSSEINEKGATEARMGTEHPLAQADNTTDSRSLLVRTDVVEGGVTAVRNNVKE